MVKREFSKDSDYYSLRDQVFDTRTLLTLYELINKGVLKDLLGPMGQGKEAKIFWGVGPDGTDLAVKIFFTANTTFVHSRKNYIEGDPRFSPVKVRNIYRLIELWARKEFGNLSRAWHAGVSTPKPIALRSNIIVMEMVWWENRRGVPAPLIKEVPPEDPKEAYLDIIKWVERAYIVGRVVHADLSEYNILNSGNRLYIIDWGSAVKSEHPNAERFLLRDIRNINKYFEKLGAPTYPEEKLASAIVRRSSHVRRVEIDENGDWLVIGGKTLIEEI